MSFKLLKPHISLNLRIYLTQDGGFDKLMHLHQGFLYSPSGWTCSCMIIVTTNIIKAVYSVAMSVLLKNVSQSFNLLRYFKR